MKILALLAVSLISISSYALEIPVAPYNALNKINLKTKLLKKDNIVADYDFEGIVKLSNCSGSIVIFNGMPTSAKAVVMTNGHCIQKPGGYLNPGEVWVNRPIKRDMKVFKTLTTLKPIKATKILYATMTDTDVAFYELDQSYDDIEAAYDVRPLTIDASRSFAGQEIEIISGYWDRGWSCNIASFVPTLKEGDWTWTDSIRYSPTCTTMGGTSGSPIIAKGERRVVGVNNTSNEDGGKCTLNNPCEVNASGEVRAIKGVRYGQQVYNVYTCLTPAFSFDLSLPGCELPR